MTTPISGQGEIVEALLAFERERKTGALEFRAQGVLTRIFVEEGLPIFAEAGVLGETLGNVLVREGMITSTQFAAAVRKMTNAIADDDDDVRFGDTLVTLGILTRDALALALATQVEKKIMGCVPRGPGDWSFDPSRVHAGTRHASPIRTLLVDAAKLLPEERVFALLSLGTEMFPVLIEEGSAIASAYGLEEAEVALVAQLDGTHTAQSFVEPNAALLCALILGKSVELLPARAASAPSESNGPIAATGRTRSLRPPAIGDAVIDIKMPEARVPSLRPARNEREADLFSEDEFQSGKRLFAQGLVGEAHAQLVLACERSPHVALYRLYEELVASRVSGAFEDAARTKALAIKMVKEDAECAFAHYVLGHVALSEGSNASAKRFFDRAFVLDRELLDAGRQARKLKSQTDGATPSPAMREIVPMGRAREIKSAPKTKPPNARLKLLLSVLAFLTFATFAYVLTTRAGLWSDYEEIH